MACFVYFQGQNDNKTIGRLRQYKIVTRLSHERDTDKDKDKGDKDKGDKKTTDATK
jgi:hypothetical protein